MVHINFYRIIIRWNNSARMVIGGNRDWEVKVDVNVNVPVIGDGEGGEEEQI